MTVNRREFAAGLGAIVGAGLTNEAWAAPAKRPNIVYVLCDEWRAQALGYAGDPNVHTPTLDRLSRESVSFENAISGLPVCSPHRASLLTGQYPLTHGVFINDVPLKPKGLTLGEAFQRAGYRTGYIGKWHVYGSPQGHYQRRLSFIPPEDHLGWEYWKVCECTHEYNRSLYYEGSDPTPRYWPGYDAIAQTADACSYIDARAKEDKPFFLTLSLGPPHFPYETAPKQYTDLYDNADIKLRPNVPDKDKEAATKILRGYYAHMSAIDDCMKTLLAKLDSAGIAEDTIFVFAADHGDMMYSQGLTTKQYPWEESVRVPFLLRYPRKLGRSGHKSAAMLNSPDIMPTLLEMCGVAIPSSVQGISYARHLLTGKSNGLPTSAFLNLPASFSVSRQAGIDSYRGVRTAQHTYVRSIHGPWLLYDRTSDPYEKHNLIDNLTMKSTQQHLEGELQGWLKKLDDEFLPGHVYLERAGLTHYFEANAPVGHSVSPWGDWKSTM